jgi:hypothetical protein
MYLRKPEIFNEETNLIKILNKLTAEIFQLGYFNHERYFGLSLKLLIPLWTEEIEKILNKEIGNSLYRYSEKNFGSSERSTQNDKKISKSLVNHMGSL